MRYYTKILPSENQRRLERLAEFRELVIEYFNNSEYRWLAEGRIEGHQAREARTNINRMLDEINTIIVLSGVSASIRHVPAPSIGGYIHNINLILNVFNLDRFNCGPNNVLDIVDRSMGIYISNQRAAQIRLFNPGYYFLMCLDWIASMPFFVIGKLGFDRYKAERSMVGRMFKFVIVFGGGIASIRAAAPQFVFLFELARDILEGVCVK